MKTTAKRVCFYPRFGPRSTGGVAVHVKLLAQGLQARGWEIVETPDEDVIVHGHAIVNVPRLDVFSCHGIYPIHERMPRWQIDANTTLFNNLKLAGEVIAVSQWTADQWSRLIGRTPRVIYNAIDPQVWQRIPSGRWRAKLQIPAKVPLVLWGKTNLSEVLDPTPLLELALRHPDYQFVAPLPQNSLHTLPKNLALVGAQPFEAMQMLLQDCDVYLATVQENHAIQVLEAMCLAKPILGYNWGGTAETVPPGGVLVKAQDLQALTAALPEVYEQRVALGKAAKEQVLARFTIDQQVSAVEEVYAMGKGRPMGSKNRPVKCSIVIPVYNKAAYVAETIKSAMHQSVAAPKYEIIVVDDGSTDDSLEVARRTGSTMVSTASEIGRRIKFYSRENAGVSAARNFGISVAQGEYICCLDADDLIDQHFLERMTAALDADPGLGIAYSDFVTFGTDKNGMPWESYITCDEYDFEKLKRGNLLPCCNLFRKVAWERAGGYKPINPSWEDYELWLNMGKLGWYGRRVPGGLFRYRKVLNVGRDNESHGQEWRLRGTVNKYHRDLYAPLISVIVPCFQHSQFLSEAIASVQAQSLPDWEVVVVDDGNAPEEATKIKQIVDDYHDDDIRLLRLQDNGGLAAARNAGIEMARGQWLVSLDADDKLDPKFLELALKATNLEAKKFAYTDCYLWWPDAAEADKRTQKLEAHDYDFDELLVRITWSCAIMFAKSAWREAGGYKPQMSEAGGWEDWEYAIQLGRDGVCGVRVPEPLFYYRQHSNEQMRVKAEAKKPLLQETLRRIHADLYRGERPTMCCGAGRRQSRAAAQPPAERSMVQAAPAVRAVPMGQPVSDVLIRYMGVRQGTQTWRAPSGVGYRFQRGVPIRVSAQDADWFASNPDFQRVTQ